MIQSKWHKDNYVANAALESSLKAERFHARRFDCIEQLQAGTQQYIRHYNHKHTK